MCYTHGSDDERLIICVNSGSHAKQVEATIGSCLVQTCQEIDATRIIERVVVWCDVVTRSFFKRCCVLGEPSISTNGDRDGSKTQLIESTSDKPRARARWRKVSHCAFAVDESIVLKRSHQDHCHLCGPPKRERMKGSDFRDAETFRKRFQRRGNLSHLIVEVLARIRNHYQARRRNLRL